MREYQVRFCERLEGETPSCLLGEPQKIELEKIHQGWKGIITIMW